MKLISLILMVGLLTFLQASGFSIFDVKPDLALASVITASFFIANFWQGILLVALAGFLLRFAPGFEKEILIFSLIGLGAIIFKSRLPWHYFLGNLILIAAGTLIFYLFLAPGLILSFVFVEEIIFNLAAGAIIFAFLYLLWKNKIA